VNVHQPVREERSRRQADDLDRTPSAQWHGEAYARSSGHHRSADDWFLRRHTPDPNDVVVDLGCGSGEFTARLAAIVPEGRVIGIDADPSMLESASRHQAPNLSFVRADAEDLSRVVSPGSVDAVVSRAMLHWIPASAHARLYTAVFRTLRPGGVFHLEAGGPGNIAGLVALLDDLAVRHGLPALPPFPDPGRAFDLIEAAGFDVDEQSARTVAMRRHFTRQQLVGLVRTQAALVLTRHLDARQGQAIVNEAIAAVDRVRRADRSWDQTFVRLEIFVRRPGQPR
jgi:SAM-dependent methyltransferase